MTAPILPPAAVPGPLPASGDPAPAPAPRGARPRGPVERQRPEHLPDPLPQRTEAGHAAMAPRAPLPARPVIRLRNRGAVAPRQPEPDQTRLRPELAEIEREAEKLKPTRAVAPAERLRATAVGTVDRVAQRPSADSPVRSLPDR